MRGESSKETKETNSTTRPSRSFTKQEHEISVRTRREGADNVRYASAHLQGYLLIEDESR